MLPPDVGVEPVDATLLLVEAGVDATLDPELLDEPVETAFEPEPVDAALDPVLLGEADVAAADPELLGEAAGLAVAVPAGLDAVPPDEACAETTTINVSAIAAANATRKRSILSLLPLR